MRSRSASDRLAYPFRTISRSKCRRSFSSSETPNRVTSPMRDPFPCLFSKLLGDGELAAAMGADDGVAGLPGAVRLSRGAGSEQQEGEGEQDGERRSADQETASRHAGPPGDVPATSGTFGNLDEPPYYNESAGCKAGARGAPGGGSMEGRDWVMFAEETARGAGEILRRNWGRQQ